MTDRPRILVACPNYEERLPLSVHECHLQAAVQWAPAYTVAWAYPPRMSVGKARTKAAREAVRLGFDFILWLDDDVLFHPSVLGALLDSIARPEVDVVGVPYLYRGGFKTDVSVPVFVPDAEVPLGNRDITHQELVDAPALFEVDGLAMGCCLMPTAVFTTSKTDRVPIAEEELAWIFTPPSFGTEDMMLFKRLKERAFRVWCRTDMLVDHLITAPTPVPRTEALAGLPGGLEAADYDPERFQTGPAPDLPAERAWWPKSTTTAPETEGPAPEAA